MFYVSYLTVGFMFQSSSGAGNPSLLLGAILQKKNGAQAFFEKKTAKDAKERKVFLLEVIEVFLRAFGFLAIGY